MTQKSQDPKPKKLFSLHTRRLAKSFDGLNSSPAQSPNKLWSCKVAKIAANVEVQSTNISYTSCEHVKSIS